ncbi:hypothetical protein TNCV_4504401 [Trichonephila clavipes]|nr:hypothetical protein TNCV_4504401 [Trichonephila clavipes]
MPMCFTMVVNLSLSNCRLLAFRRMAKSRCDLPHGGPLESPYDHQRQPGQQVHQLTAMLEEPPARICTPRIPVFLRQGQVF